MVTTTTTQPRILARLAFLDALVRQIGPERVASVGTGPVHLHPVDRADGHRIAVDLIAAGAIHVETNRGLQDDPDGGYISHRLDIEGEPVTVFASPTPTVYDIARIDGHSESCAGRQHMSMTSQCTCGRRAAVTR